jgi:hypothetical protein
MKAVAADLPPNQALHLHEHPGIKPQTEKPRIEKSPAMQSFAEKCDLVHPPHFSSSASYHLDCDHPLSQHVTRNSQPR